MFLKKNLKNIKKAVDKIMPRPYNENVPQKSRTAL
jgi:hypothetical protein